MSMIISSQAALRIEKFAKGFGYDGPHNYRIETSSKKDCVFFFDEISYRSPPLSDEEAITRGCRAILESALRKTNLSFLPTSIGFAASTIVLALAMIVSYSYSIFEGTTLIFAGILAFMGSVSALILTSSDAKARKWQVDRAMLALCAEQLDVRNEYLKILKAERLEQDERNTGLTGQIDQLESMEIDDQPGH